MVWQDDPDAIDERAADRAYLAESAPAGAMARRLWLMAAWGTGVGMLLPIDLARKFAPDALRRMAGGLHAVMPRWFAGAGAPLATIIDDLTRASSVVALTAGPLAAAIYVARHRLAIARGFGAADARVGGLYLARPDRLPNVIGLALSAVMFGSSWIGWLAAILASHALGAWLTRLAAARDGRVRLAWRLLVRCLRSASPVIWLSLLGLAVTAVIFAKLDKPG